MSNCYSAGSITCNQNVGGVIGLLNTNGIEEANLTKCYYLVDVCENRLWRW